MLTGMGSANVARWVERDQVGRQIGFARLLDPVSGLIEALEARAHSVHWDPAQAVVRARELSLLCRVADE